MHKKNLVFGLALALSLIADQLTKVWARHVLKPARDVIIVIEGFWDFRYSENEGVAFGMLRGLPYGRYLLFVVGMVALYVVLTFLRRTRADKLRVAAELGLLAGGALGNIIDRVVFGRVTDFVLWHIHHKYEWPVFNVADAALVVGVIGLLIDTRHGFEEDKDAKDKDAPNKDKKAKK